jgi:hypothetical protein
LLVACAVDYHFRRGKKSCRTFLSLHRINQWQTIERLIENTSIFRYKASNHLSSWLHGHCPADRNSIWFVAYINAMRKPSKKKRKENPRGHQSLQQRPSSW